MSIRKGVRALLMGALLCLLCLVYLPRCGMQIAPQDVTVISIGLSTVFTILAYRFV